MMGHSASLPPLFLFGALLLLPSCWKEDYPAWGKVSGMRPVYLPESSLNDIRNLPPQDINNTGTIFLRDTLFFMLETGRGIHVFSVQDPTWTYPVTFFKIPAISDFTIAGERLYADSWRDLVTLDISDILAIRVIQRQPGVFQPSLFPPNYQGLFECVDLSQGAVVGWEDTEIENPRCRTIQ
jgi:hypothetical protein